MKINLSSISLMSIALVGIITLTMWGCPQYRVYEQNLEGEAELARAQQNRQIKISEADAAFESASKLAAADTIRAHGVARSNVIIGSSLHNNREYLDWLWIDNIEKNPNAVYYIPTENKVPIFVNK